MTNRRSRLAALVMLGAMIATFAAAVPVSANTVGNTEGCTPGYWKNHPDSWQEAAPTDTISTIFYSGTLNTQFASMTLLAGLSLKGGPGIDGAQQILLRAAIASFLNAAYDSPDGLHLAFPWRRNATGFNGEPPLVPTVNAALSSGSRDTMLALATQLDQANNLGCPLS